jgi:hypothetical protein
VQYVLLVYETEEAFADRSREARDEFWGAWRAYSQALLDAGVYVAGTPLEPPATATTINLENGKRKVQDGPFANTREQLGGFILLEVPSLSEAMDWAAQCPAAAYGAVEIRPVDPTVDSRMGVPGLFPAS